MAYTALLPVANRFRDSAISAPEGTTQHLARGHMQDWVAAMGRIAATLQATVLEEMAQEGLFCQCVCPACGLGLCVCGIGARAILHEAWVAARPYPDLAEIRVPRLRPTSAAAVSGVHEGDLVLAVDGTDVQSMPHLQTQIGGHEFGSTLRLSLRRGEAELTVAVTRANDIGDGSLPLDCEVPSGQAFYLDRARDLQKHIRSRAKGRRAPGGLPSLSAREIQVLRLLADGATNPMIAHKLGIQRPTVARHVASVLAKLDVTNRAEAAGLAAAAGLKQDSQ
jgi:DNA-binding CsgD family transcriptional regulator